MKKIINVDGINVPIGTHEGKTIVIGADHRGFEYKCRIIEELKNNGYKVIDVGTNSSERCDYPPISNDIGRLVSQDKNYNTAGIGICGSGIGILIPASKHKGIIGARCLNPKEAELSRKHNNSNVLCIGADFTSLETAIATVNAWLKTPFYSDSKKDEAYLRRYIQTVEQENVLYR